MSQTDSAHPVKGSHATSLVVLTTVGLAVVLALISWLMTHPDPRHQHPQRADDTSRFFNERCTRGNERFASTAGRWRPMSELQKPLPQHARLQSTHRRVPQRSTRQKSI